MKQKSARTRLLTAALTTALLVACSSTPKQESTGEYLDDSAITTRVKTALVADKQVSAMDVNVETYKGTVQLSGFANSDTEKQRAAEIARSVSGVKSVKNDIRLK